MWRAALVVLGMSWWQLASAAPGVIAVARAELHEAPFDAARVIAERAGGDPVCVVDAPRGIPEGWLGVRNVDGVAYVRRDAVDLAGSPDAARYCGDVDAMSRAAGTHPEVGSFLPRRPVRIAFGLGSGAAWLREDAAARHHIGNVGFTFNATLGFSIEDVIVVSGLGGATFPADHATFDEDVVSLGGGDPHTETSHLEVQSYGAAVGLRTPFYVVRTTPTGLIAASAFADVGRAYIRGTRMIERCGGCRKEDLDMPSGSFWRAGVELSTRQTSPPPRLALSYGLSVAYQSFEAGAGLTRELRIGLMLWFL